MAQLFHIHPETPQQRLINQAVDVIKDGGIVIYPTDSAYALGCQLSNKSAMVRIRRIRQLDEKHNFTLMCRDLSELSTYAHVDNPSYRLLKAFTPGPYTFILKATKEVPRRMLHPKRKTLGLRVPDHPIVRDLLETLGEPIMSTTMIMPNESIPMIEPDAMHDLLGKQVDLIIHGGYCGIEPTTVVDLTGETPVLVRVGKGDPSPFE